MLENWLSRTDDKPRVEQSSSEQQPAPPISPWLPSRSQMAAAEPGSHANVCVLGNCFLLPLSCIPPPFPPALLAALSGGEGGARREGHRHHCPPHDTVIHCEVGRRVGVYVM
eukprot:GHVU01110702.1.p2 GENE.GHVU01110702.1~~GHVU01110702.1.p2  ORF type:complete len:112 (+),score=11.22 GHVU01110702.1:595-930(+)